MIDIVQQRRHYGRVRNRVSSARELDALPVGAEFGDSSHTYKKLAEGLFERVGTTIRYNTAQFSAGQYRVTYLPEGFEPCDPPQETVEGYMFRFRDEALSAAIANGVSYSASEEAVQKMGVKDIPLGYGVPVKNRLFLEALPNGTVIWSGSPEYPSTFSVWVRSRSSWKQVLGDGPTMLDTAYIHTVDGDSEPPPWLTREGTEEDAEAIRKFRAKAWRVGWELKRTQGWCSTYESVMRSLGLTQAVLREARTDSAHVGERYSAEEARTLPPGTVLKWESKTTTDWAYYLRVAAMENENVAGTRLICGHVQSRRNYRSSMTVVALHPDEGMEPQPLAVMPFVDTSFIGHLLVGTVFGYGPGNTRYVMAHDGKAAQWSRRGPVPPTGMYNSDQFGTYENLYYYGWDGDQR